MSRYDGIIRISKTRNVKTPTRGTPLASGLDFYVPEDLTVSDMEAMFDKTGHVLEYETGENDIPTAILIRLSDIYNVSVDYMLGLSNRKTRD